VFESGRSLRTPDTLRGSKYIQHNPMAGDGSGPFVDFVKAYTGQFPELSVEIKRVVAEDDPADVAGAHPVPAA
jgi:predicted SnoaL-like aldol condensation-catalyzing enzyme